MVRNERSNSSGHYYNRNVVVIIVLLLTIQINVFSEPVVLWGSTHLGMTPDEVLTTVPDSRPNFVSEGDELVDGAVPLIVRDGFQLVGEEFQVFFYFIDQRLIQVTLDYSQGQTFHDAKRVFDSLLTALRVRYGQELSNDEHNFEGVMRVLKTQWISGRTSVLLRLLSLPDLPPILRVVYQTRIADEADKL